MRDRLGLSSRATAGKKTRWMSGKTLGELGHLSRSPAGLRMREGDWMSLEMDIILTEMWREEHPWDAFS